MNGRRRETNTKTDTSATRIKSKKVTSSGRTSLKSTHNLATKTYGYGPDSNSYKINDRNSKSRKEDHPKQVSQR